MGKYIMERVTKLRRVALLCCHFVRNYAYYKASEGGEISNEFWKTIHSNFLDIAVLHPISFVVIVKKLKSTGIIL